MDLSGGSDRLDRQITLALVDDHALLRDGIRSLLAAEPDIVMVAEGQDGEAAAALASQHQPGVLLLDPGLPGQPVHVTIAEVRQASATTRVILLSDRGDPVEAGELLSMSNVRGYVVKDCGWFQVLGAIREVMRGNERTILASSRVALDRVLDELVPGGAGPALVSDRVLVVLQFAAYGLTDRAIAEALHIGEATVRRRLAEAYKALGAANRPSAIALAVAGGWIHPGVISRHAETNGQNDVEVPRGTHHP